MSHSRPLFQAHESLVVGRRVERLAQLIARIPPVSASVLDVGCGSGEVLAEILRNRPDLSPQARGIDVLIRPDTAFPVEQFDGTTIPYDDKSVDVLLLVDVLHHTEDPTALLAEAARVARVAVIVKDHVRHSRLDSLTLRFMDYVGNARHGVDLPYNYLSRTEWDRAFAAAGLSVENWMTQLSIYPVPARWVFDRSLHVLATLTPRPPHE